MKKKMAVTVVTSVGILGSLGMPAALAEIDRQGRPHTGASAYGGDRAAASERQAGGLPRSYQIADRDGDDGGDDGHRKNSDDRNERGRHGDDGGDDHHDGHDDGHD